MNLNGFDCVQQRVFSAGIDVTMDERKIPQTLSPIVLVLCLV